MATASINKSTPLSMADIRKLAKQINPSADEGILDAAKSAIGLVGAHIRVAAPDIRDAYRVHLARLRA